MIEKNRDKASLPYANMEPDPCNESKRSNAMQKINKPVVISVHSRRYRFADPDGISAKWAIDAIVKAGVLVDDSAKEVKEVRFSQEKISKEFEEDTIITIEEV